MTDWPGLASVKLYEDRDLEPTADLRAVLKGLLADHIAVSRAGLDERVFPGSGSIRPNSGLISI